MKLLVAALQSELSAFPESIPGWDILVTKAGKTSGTFGLTRALVAGDYEEVLVVGTAGAIDPTLEMKVYDIDAAIQHDALDENKVRGSHVSLPQRVEIGSGDMLIATGDQFIDDAAEVELISGLGGRLVDMETFSYIWVAQQLGVPIRVWKSVSDKAHGGASNDWNATVARCSAQLYERFTAEYPQA